MILLLILYFPPISFFDDKGLRVEIAHSVAKFPFNPGEFLPMEDEVVGGDTFRVIQEKGIQCPLYGIEVNLDPIIRKRNVSVCVDYLGRLGGQGENPVY